MPLLHDLGDFITTPLFRWVLMFAGIIINILQYINEPQRYSYKLSIEGISFKWHIYLITIIGCITTALTLIGMWSTIPFTDLLPDYWYLYLCVLYVAIITQITIDSPQYIDDGSFNPPPTFLFPQQYRVLIAYVGLIVDALIMVQIYIYFGVSDLSKNTLFSHYVLERFGGWIDGNKADFLFEWTGLLHVGLKLYLLILQKNFQACYYGLPSSWNA